MKTVELNCRNFKCPSNIRGECCLETVNLEPCGPHLDILRCIEAPRSEVDDEKVKVVDGKAVRPEGTDPSSR